MKTHGCLTNLAALLCAAAALVTAPAGAASPKWGDDARGGPPHNQVQLHRHGDRPDARPPMPPRSDSPTHPQAGGYFSDGQRQAARDYYGAQFRAGRCPPGLAKKRNGCQPPGQAKKWRIGAPLPRDVVYHTVPDEVVVRLGIPPAGHRYVRVAADILMITTGAGLVVDAIEDLMRR